MKIKLRQAIVYKLVCIIALLVVFMAATALSVVAQDNPPPDITVRFAPSPGSFEDGRNYIHTGRFGFRIDSFPEPEPPAGYVFVGWFVGGSHVLPPIANTRNTTLIAGYAPEQDPYDTARFAIVYDSGEGQLPENTPSILALTYGSPLISLPIPVKEGYSFSGWIWDEEPVTAPFIVRGDMILEAVWVPTQGDNRTANLSGPMQIPALHFAIAFNPFPGAFGRGETGLRFGRGATTVRQMPDAPTRRGAVFTGWQMPCGQMLEPTSLIREDTMLVAIWDTNPESTPPPATTEPRRNPQTSPIRISVALLFAITMIASGLYTILKLTGKQNAAAGKYKADMRRYVREVRMEIKNKNK
ncbi:MAG: InlB B-repeat-containing protein [Defluviitaleaceae bacterium]|nr:InlB B-repeat-containing protein [Defluviitaleaceae bacterium]